jgi:MFS family permease
MRRPRGLWPQGGLWRHADFLKLWSAQSISQLGTQISGIALPLVALYTLHATAFQVAALGTVEFLPFLLFTLPAGVWVDRLRRRWIMIVADSGRALTLGSVPVAFALGDLTLAQLYVVGFLTGTLTVFFDVSYQSYLPSIVEREQLVDGNAKLEITRSGAQILGPGLGGLLVHAITAPYTVLADAISYLWSASFLFGIRKPEAVPERDADSPSMLRELIDGIKYLVRHRYWRPISISTATFNFFSNVAFAIFVVYMVRRLHLSALAIGLTFSLSSAGGLAAAFFAQKIGTRLGIGRTIVWGSAIGAVPAVLIPLAPASFPIPLIVVSLVFMEFGVVVYNVSAISLTQALVPERLLGRVNASRRFIVWGTIPLGSLVSGVLATTIGLRPTLFVGTIGLSLATLPVALSAVRHVKELPTAPEEMPFGEEAMLPVQAATLTSEHPTA